MNYIRIANNFWDNFGRNPLSTSAVAIFFYIVNQCNRAHWQMPVSCSTSTICENLGIDKSTLVRSRKKLKDRGLLVYCKGRRNVCTPTYTIIDGATTNATTNATSSKKENINYSATTASELMYKGSLQDIEREWFVEIMGNEDDKEALAMDFNISVEKVNQLLEKFKADVDFTQEKHPNRVAFRQHVKRWLNRHLEINNNKNKEYDQTNRTGSATSTYEKRREAAESLVKELGNRPDLGKQIW